MLCVKFTWKCQLHAGFLAHPRERVLVALGRAWKPTEHGSFSRPGGSGTLLEQGQQAFSVKNQIINILDLVGFADIVSVVITQFC